MKRILKNLKKSIFILLAGLIFSLSLAPTAKAAVTTSWYNQSFSDWYVRVYSGNESEIFGERYTAAQVQWILYSLYAQIIGIGVSNNQDIVACVLSQDVDQCQDSIQNTLKDLVSYNEKIENNTFLSAISSSPISGIGYIKNLIQKFRIVPNTYAQEEGFGYSAASPVLTLWKLARDVSYAFLVVVIIVFAFMIMFRVKINPQTVITIQSALPKVILSAILITFSYAIAGLLIDLMYVVMALVVAILTNQSSGLFEWGFADMMSALLNRNIFMIFMGYWLVFFIASLSHIASVNVFYGVILTIASIVLFFILLFLSIKTIFLLLKNFAMILLTIIIGPLEILVGTVSSSGGGFGQWLKKLLSYLAVYPIVTVLILLAHFFLAQGLPEWLGDLLAKPGGANFMPFNPKFRVIGTAINQNWSVPFTVGDQFDMSIVWMVVSYVIISLIPKVFDMIKAFMERKPFDFGTAIGETTGPLKAIGNWGPVATARQYSSDYGAYKLAGTLQKIIPTTKFTQTIGLRSVPGGRTGVIEGIEQGAKSRLNIQ